MLKIALTKGRVEEQAIPLLEACGIDCEPLRNKKRKLVIPLGDDLEVILVKGGDVLTYLNNGVVDLGIVGSDVLDEQQNVGYELLDLKTGVCRFILASLAEYNLAAQLPNSGRADESLGHRDDRRAGQGAREVQRGRDSRVARRATHPDGVQGAVDLRGQDGALDRGRLRRVQEDCAQGAGGVERRMDGGQGSGWICTIDSFYLSNRWFYSSVQEM